MSGDRASIFGADNEFDVSGFAPKPVEKLAAKPAVKQEQVRVVSEAASFRSREPKTAHVVPVAPQKREQRRYRTGRNAQLNIKIKPETLEDFYALVDRTGWVQGEAFERAIEALKRELTGQK
jgi:hypothetical protein